MRFFDCLFDYFFEPVTNDGDVNEGDEMSREEIVNNGVQAIQSGVSQVYGEELGKAFDGGFGEGVQSVPTGGDPSKIYTQEELDQRLSDALVAAKQGFDQQLADALAADEVIDQEKLEAAHVEAQAQIDAVTAALGEMSAKYNVANDAVQSFQSKIDGLQGALDLLKSLIMPAPTPEPTPEPAQE